MKRNIYQDLIKKGTTAMQDMLLPMNSGSTRLSGHLDFMTEIGEAQNKP